MDTPVIYRVTLEIELDEPLQDAEEKSAICTAIESIIEGDAFHEAMAGVDLHIGVAQALALEPVRHDYDMPSGPQIGLSVDVSGLC